MELFDRTLPWFKGNLHTHTDVSDGAVSPEEAYEYYHAAGYDFLALTEHNKVVPDGTYKGMTLLKGVELAYNDMTARKAYHFVAIDPDDGITDFRQSDFDGHPQAIIDHIRAHHGYCILCHPDWSLLSAEDMLALNGYEAVEVMNSVSDPATRGDSSHTIDALMARGRPMPLVASDDSHHYTGEQCHSATLVNAPSNSREDLMAALRNGQFYATEGPRFRTIRVENGQIIVRSSPVRTIHFFSDAFSALQRKVNCELNRNYACYNIGANDRFVRIQLTDFEGRRAWSSYIDVRTLR